MPMHTVTKPASPSYQEQGGGEERDASDPTFLSCFFSESSARAQFLDSFSLFVSLPKCSSPDVIVLCAFVNTGSSLAILVPFLPFGQATENKGRS